MENIHEADIRDDSSFEVISSSEEDEYSASLYANSMPDSLINRFRCLSISDSVDESEIETREPTETPNQVSFNLNNIKLQLEDFYSSEFNVLSYPKKTVETETANARARDQRNDSITETEDTTDRSIVECFSENQERKEECCNSNERTNEGGKNISEGNVETETTNDETVEQKSNSMTETTHNMQKSIVECFGENYERKEECFSGEDKISYSPFLQKILNFSNMNILENVYQGMCDNRNFSITKSLEHTDSNIPTAEYGDSSIPTAEYGDSICIGSNRTSQWNTKTCMPSFQNILKGTEVLNIFAILDQDNFGSKTDESMRVKTYLTDPIPCEIENTSSMQNMQKFANRKSTFDIHTSDVTSNEDTIVLKTCISSNPSTTRIRIFEELPQQNFAENVNCSNFPGSGDPRFCLDPTRCSSYRDQCSFLEQGKKILSWLRSNAALQSLINGAKSSVANIFHTLGFGRTQLWDLWTSLPIVIIVVADLEDYMTIRDSFHDAFKGQVSFCHSWKKWNLSSPALYVGYDSAIQAAQNKIHSAKQQLNSEAYSILVTTNRFVFESSQQSRWQMSSVLLLEDPNLELQFHNFSQTIPIPNIFIHQAQKMTPEDYPWRDQGFAVTLKGAVDTVLNTKAGNTEDFLTGIENCNTLKLAADILASTYCKHINSLL